MAKKSIPIDKINPPCVSIQFVEHIYYTTNFGENQGKIKNLHKQRFCAPNENSTQSLL